MPLHNAQLFTTMERYFCLLLISVLPILTRGFGPPLLQKSKSTPNPEISRAGALRSTRSLQLNQHAPFHGITSTSATLSHSRVLENVIQWPRLLNSQQAGLFGFPLTFDGVLQGLISLVSTVVRFLRQLSSYEKLLCISSFLLGLFVGSVCLSSPFWRRFTNLNDIPSRRFSPRAKPLRGRVVRVSDGDTVRFLHRPTFLHPKRLRKGCKLSEYALPIRLCTIDTPEVAKFGKPGQPFGPEAKLYLTELVGNRPVYVRLLSRDQYGRAVGQVFLKRFGGLWRQHMDASLLRAGLAEVYSGAGAVYGPKGKEYYVGLEQAAMHAKVGMWSLGEERQTAAEYKRATKS